jgi:hypothetical protein
VLWYYVDLVPVLWYYVDLVPVIWYYVEHRAVLWYYVDLRERVLLRFVRLRCRLEGAEKLGCMVQGLGFRV